MNLYMNVHINFQFIVYLINALKRFDLFTTFLVSWVVWGGGRLDEIKLAHISTKLKLKLSLAIKRDIVSTTSLPVDRLQCCWLLLMPI